MDLHKNSDYKKIREGYGSAFSIYGALLNNSGRRNLSNDQCWCNDADKHLPPNNRCHPQMKCNDCDLNKTGWCPQDSGSDPLPGVT